MKQLRSADASPRIAIEMPSAGRASSPGLSFAVIAIALVVVVAHLLTNSRYGFHRDELQTLSDALHLDWGFVAYPPLTPFLERMAMGIFGFSLVGLRLFSVIAMGAAIIVTGLMARDLGGSRWSQTAAALAVAVSPLPLFEGTEFQYTTFDFLWCVLIAWFVIRLLKSEDPRWCLATGALVGVGLMTKYTMAFYLAGILGGLLLTPARRFLATRWFWIGTGLALLIFAPNLIWQIRHDFISLHFLQHIHTRDVGEGRAQGFWRAQFLLCANRFAAPLWLAGLAAFFYSRRYRTLAWMYVIPVVILWAAKGRGYYTGGMYPMLMAMGSASIEPWLTRRPQLWGRAVQIAYLIALAGWGVYVSLAIVPWASSGRLKTLALANNGDLREEIGWTDLVKNIAAIRDSLPETQREHVGVLVGNYGEQGAVEILGRAYHLPPPISGTNSAWLRGYPIPPPTTLIVVGHSRGWVEKNLESCQLAGHNANAEGVHNEESDDHPEIFVCGPPLLPWPEFWKQSRYFG